MKGNIHDSNQNLKICRNDSMMKTLKYKYNATESQKNREGKKKGI